MASATVGQDDDDSPDCAEARALFKRAGLAFPAMPAQFRRRLARHDRWLYATRPIGDSPYMIDTYVEEAVRARVPDYALLAHAGHSFNSWAIHYYLVHGGLCLLVQAGWGGAYMGEEETALQREAFAVCDAIVAAAARVPPGRIPSGQRVIVAASDFYGGRWARPGERLAEGGGQRPGTYRGVLDEALAWLTAP